MNSERIADNLWLNILSNNSNNRIDYKQSYALTDAAGNKCNKCPRNKNTA